MSCRAGCCCFHVYSYQTTTIRKLCGKLIRGRVRLWKVIEFLQHHRTFQLREKYKKNQRKPFAVKCGPLTRLCNGNEKCRERPTNKLPMDLKSMVVSSRRSALTFITARQRDVELFFEWINWTNIISSFEASVHIISFQLDRPCVATTVEKSE